MGLTIADSYYLKAHAATEIFGGDWEQICESLNYALSYDENHCPSLCLLGEIYVRNLFMPEKGFECFDKVIAINSDYDEVYTKYALCLIWSNEVERAKKLIKFAHSVKTIDSAQLYWLSSYVQETKNNYKKCLKLLKKAKSVIYNDDYLSFMESEEKRIKKKMKLEQPKSKKKNKPSSKKSTKNK